MKKIKEHNKCCDSSCPNKLSASDRQVIAPVKNYQLENVEKGLQKQIDGIDDRITRVQDNMTNQIDEYLKISMKELQRSENELHRQIHEPVIIKSYKTKNYELMVLNVITFIGVVVLLIINIVR